MPIIQSPLQNKLQKLRLRSLSAMVFQYPLRFLHTFYALRRPRHKFKSPQRNIIPAFYTGTVLSFIELSLRLLQFLQSAFLLP